jgi:hypothetical protein
MNPEARAEADRGYVETLSLPARLAARQYLEAMKRLYPDLADQADAGPGNEGAVYVYVPLPHDDDQNIEIPEAMAEVGAQTVADAGLVIVLMPTTP